ncbi:MAG: M23 family metallopeptidase [Anaerotignum sp.]|nr:M23 family metallopeptidase [Anaerotignum sp.]
MKKNENKTAMQVRTIAVCGCLCLLAVGAGVTYRAYDSSHMEPEEQPVTAVKSPTIEVVQMERNKQSNDPGEAPEVKKPEQKKDEVTSFAWPIHGEVVMPYSMDHAVYDPTLEQYRTNASISISAEKGAEVKAAADGTVTAVAEDAENGKMVTISHEAGWLTTYGQLEDAVTVKKGDKVKKGQVIGSVDAPTKYGVALGEHLEFGMKQGGESKDPTRHLEQK